ncbi:macrolide family glycosyltransferase [Streptomyces sp. NPDC048612]|uniref:macrolide family glycosyltransferase n=1 Tax=Streptomyces sp. NPDC048612 TaxID=3365579 RepID=UPI00371F7A55
MPGLGHITPTLEVVAELVRRGHRVTYLVAEPYAPFVAETGARVVPYASPLPDEPPAAVVDGDVLAGVPLKYLREGMLALASGERALAADRPDLIVYDTTMFAAGRILARKWGLPAVRTFPTLAANEHFSLDTLVPEELVPVNPNHPALGEFFMTLVGLFAQHGMASVDVGRFLAEIEETNVAFLPREIQIRGETFDDRFVFSGPCIGSRAFDTEWEFPSDGKPLVLISLGTSFNDSPDFFRMCAQAFGDVPWNVVMTLGRRGDPAALGPLPPNVTAHRWVPHPAVLRNASAFVTQGGMGSAMEALYCGTPMVVVPSTPEQEVNARRLVELELARRQDLSTATGESLRDAVLALASDTGMAARLEKMRDVVRGAGGAVRAADAIEGRL